jgi:hypothetical protein
MLYMDFSNSLTLLSSLRLLIRKPWPYHVTLVDMPHPNERITMIISTFTATKLVPEIYDDHLIINYCFNCRDHGHMYKLISCIYYGCGSDLILI